MQVHSFQSLLFPVPATVKSVLPLRLQNLLLVQGLQQVQELHLLLVLEQAEEVHNAYFYLQPKEGVLATSLP